MAADYFLREACPGNTGTKKFKTHSFEPPHVLQKAGAVALWLAQDLAHARPTFIDEECMSTFNQRIKPATEAHMNAQFSFLEDMSKTLFQSFQKISELNLQLTQTLIADSARLGRDIASAEKPQEILSATAAQAQPTAEKLRDYKDNLARISADAQVELTRCAERHVPETSRTAKALAEELVKISAEAAQKAMQTQQDVIRQGAASADASGAAASRADAADLQRQTEENVQAGLHNGAEAVRRATADASSNP